MKLKLKQIEFLIDSNEMDEAQLKEILEEGNYSKEDIQTFFLDKLKDANTEIDDRVEDYKDEEYDDSKWES